VCTELNGYRGYILTYTRDKLTGKDRKKEVGIPGFFPSVEGWDSVDVVNNGFALCYGVAKSLAFGSTLNERPRVHCLCYRMERQTI
jgi:hypothetical protein